MIVFTFTLSTFLSTRLTNGQNFSHPTNLIFRNWLSQIEAARSYNKTKIHRHRRYFQLYFQVENQLCCSACASIATHADQSVNKRMENIVATQLSDRAGWDLLFARCLWKTFFSLESSRRKFPSSQILDFLSQKILRKPGNSSCLKSNWNQMGTERKKFNLVIKWSKH